MQKSVSFYSADANALILIFSPIIVSLVCKNSWANVAFETTNVFDFFSSPASIEITTSEYYGRNYTIEFKLVGEVNKRVFEIVDVCMK